MSDRSMIYALILGGVACFAVYRMTSASYEDQRLKDAQDVAQYVGKVQGEREAYNAQIADKEQTIRGISERYREAAAKDKADSGKWRDCVKSGNCGLQVAASCPAGATGSSKENKGGSVDSGGVARLNASAEQDYFTLREGLSEQKKKLDACQAALREVAE